jgi:hypothetical protein
VGSLSPLIFCDTGPGQEWKGYFKAMLFHLKTVLVLKLPPKEGYPRE